MARQPLLYFSYPGHSSIPTDLSGLPAGLRMDLELQKLLLKIFRALAPLIRRRAHDLLKVPVKRGQGVKTAFMCDIGYRNVCFFQILAGRPHPYQIDIFQRTHFHIRRKNPPEMRLAHMAFICQICNLEIVLEISFHILDRIFEL